MIKQKQYNKKHQDYFSSIDIGLHWDESHYVNTKKFH